MLLFSKRIDADSASDPDNYKVMRQGRVFPCSLQVVKTDGNRVLLHSEHFFGDCFDLEVSGIKDTPSLWLFDGCQANEVPPNSRVTVPPFF
jgi:hypothetical protein